MPLHHWPNPRVPWRSFYNHWIVRIVEQLNGVLPPGFRARPTELIVGIEPDVLLLHEWAYDFAVGDPLPTPPLFLRADQLRVMVDLEASYQATLQAGRYEPA
ncbi:MAG: hypothetical protein HY872_10530 [Chloroflexi bacterium]|nr:hypothetical protein [Chloroflexota bacterium]MBI5828655.1 hypothetical protein [Chloroflexota bacterium]